MNMKKWTSLLLASIMLLALTACGSKSGGDSGSQSGSDGVYAEEGYGEGRIGDVIHTYFFDFTINSAHMADSYGSFTPAEGKKVLVVEMTIKNTSSSSLPMWDDDFQGQWSTSQETEEFSYPITEDGLGNELDTVSDTQFPASYDLAVNEERTGDLVFEVPADEKDFSISTMELFDDGTEEGEEGDTFFVFFTAE